MRKLLHQLEKITLLLLLLAIVGGCGSASSKTEQAASSTNFPLVQAVSNFATPIVPSSTQPIVIGNMEWNLRWLKGVPCKLPCFEGIIPGKTTLEEALEVLRKHPQVANQNFQYNSFPDKLMPLLSSRKDYTRVSWTWTINASNRYGGNSSRSSSFPVPIVSSFSFYSDDVPKILRSIETGLDQIYSFEEIQKAFGDPDYVYAKSEPKANKFISRSLLLYYLNDGFLVAYEDDVNKPIIFTTTSLFGSPPTVFAPGVVGYQNNIVYPYAIAVDELMPWEGLKSFEYYCEKNMKRKCE